MSKLYGLVVRWLFVSSNDIKMQFLGCSRFHKLQFDCLLLKGIQWLKIYFCVHFTYSILSNVVLGKTDFEIIFTSFLSFKILKIRPLVLWKIRHGSRRSPSWLKEESVMALWEIRHGSGKNLSPLETVFSLYWSVSRGDGFLPEPWRISRRAMTDFLQSHDGLLLEPWRIFHRTRGLIFGILKTQKGGENYFKICFA